MPRKRKLNHKLPPIDGQLEDFYYRAYPWTIGKEKARAAFKFRYGVPPDHVFFGKPNGAFLYAGPVPDKEATARTFTRRPQKPVAIKLATIKG